MQISRCSAHVDGAMGLRGGREHTRWILICFVIQYRRVGMICGPNDVQAISENLSLPANIVCAEDLLTRVFFISFSFSIKSALHPLLTHTPSVCQPSINIVIFPPFPPLRNVHSSLSLSVRWHSLPDDKQAGLGLSFWVMLNHVMIRFVI